MHLGPSSFPLAGSLALGIVVLLGACATLPSSQTPLKQPSALLQSRSADPSQSKTMASGNPYAEGGGPVFSSPNAPLAAGPAEEPIHIHSGPFAVIRGEVFELDIAVTVSERTRGLSARSNLPHGAGMLFVFPSERIVSFWMKKMEFPLDIIWLSKDGIIIDIDHNTPPQPGVHQDQLKRYYPREPAMYALEINAGLSETYGFRRKDSAAFHNLPSRALLVDSN